MEGNNLLIINRQTMAMALQYYFNNSVFKEAGYSVEKVEEDKEKDGFHVEVLKKPYSKQENNYEV